MLLMQPESLVRNGQELRLQLALGGVLALTRGWSVDVGEVYTQSFALTEVIGDEASLAPLRRYMFGLAVTRADLRRALPLADQVMQDASRINSPGALLFAHYALGSLAWVAAISSNRATNFKRRWSINTWGTGAASTWTGEYMHVHSYILES